MLKFMIGGLVISMTTVVMLMTGCSETPEPPGPPPPEDALLWEFSTGEQPRDSGDFLMLASAVTQGTVYAASGSGQVYALDATTGQVRWHTELDAQLYPPPVVGDSKVYLRSIEVYYTLDANTGEVLETSEERGPRHTEPPSDPETGRTYQLDVGLPPGTRVHAVDAATGTRIWTYDVGSIVPVAPTQSGGTLLVRSYEGVHALDESTGELLWEAEWEFVGDHPSYVVDGIWAVAGDGTVTALDARTGKRLWSFGEDRIIRIAGAADGMVLAKGSQGFYGIEAATGQKKWSLNNDWRVYHVTVADGVIYANVVTGDLHTLDLQTGEPIWTQRIGYYLAPEYGLYRVVDGVVYVTHREIVRAYRAPTTTDTRPPAETRTPTPTPEPGEGPSLQRSDRLWRFDTGRNILPLLGDLFGQTSSVALSPLIVQGTFYAVSDGGEVYAVNAQTGELLWSIDLETKTWAPPVAAGSTVYIEHQTDDYYSLDAATGEHLLPNIEETGRIRGVEPGDGAVHVTAVFPDGRIVVRSYEPQTGQLLQESRPQVPDLDYLRFKVTVLGDITYIRDGPTTHAFDSPSGNLLWSFDADVITRSAPAASDGVVFMRSAFAAHALDETTGDVVWKFDGPYGDWTKHPTYIVDGVWAALLRYGALHGLDAATGQPLWSHPDGYAFFVAGADNGMVFVVGEDGCRALDAATGDEIWSLGIAWEMQDVTVADGVLYSNSEGGWLHALDARTGEPIWTTDGVNRPLGVDPYFVDPYLVRGRVLYLAQQGTILALPAPQGR